VPLAKPRGIFSVAQCVLFRLCQEGPQSASIDKASKSSAPEALIFRLVGPLGGGLAMGGRL